MSQDEELRNKIEDGLIIIDQHVSDRAMSFLLELIHTREATLIREARIDELDNLYNRGHTAERASVPNENSLINFDQPDWITISTPIFYCYMSTIKERITELTNQQKGL